MRLVAQAGLWRTGPQAASSPLVAVLEVSGAVMSWTVDDPSGSTATEIVFTDLSRADWLWRVFGEDGHVAVAAAADGRMPEESHAVEVAGVGVVPGSVDPLRRLAIGHWLRRWWPASHRDGIAGLDRALLDAEIALNTVALQDFFTDDTLDSDVLGLLEPHAAALASYGFSGDQRIHELVERCADLAQETGLVWPEPASPRDYFALHRDDYALAAGREAGVSPSSVIARGTASIKWAGVPPAIFDAAENTIDWRIEAGPMVAGLVRVAIAGTDSATGIPVRLRSGMVGGQGVLDGAGDATVQLVDADRRPMPELAAWDHDWSSTTVTVGAEVEEAPEVRERIRDFARARLSRPADDAYWAEILAAESDY